jgi:hypothetical protein
MMDHPNDDGPPERLPNGRSDELEGIQFADTQVLSMALRGLEENEETLYGM